MWPLWLLLRRWRRLLLLGAVGNALIVALWGVDRIWGLPFGAAPQKRGLQAKAAKPADLSPRLAHTSQSQKGLTAPALESDAERAPRSTSSQALFLVVGAAPPGGSDPGHSYEDVQRRIARYLSCGERETDQANHDHADAARKSSVESTAPERPLPAPAPEPPEHVDSAANSAPCHLVFISDPRGYALVELDGPPPALGEDIALPEQPGFFQVAKLGRSPLPNDPRICAYLSPNRVGPLGAETAGRV